MPIKKLKLEDVVYGLEDLIVKVDYKLGIAGIYDPNRDCINYNPKRIIDKTDFFITILHELIHHLDTNMKLTEDEVEKSAERNLKTEEIKDYLEIFFTEEVKKYWSK